MRMPSRHLLLTASVVSAVVFTTLVTAVAARAGGEPPPALPAGTSLDWWSQAQRDLAAREYQASTSERGLQAPNRAQGFRTYFDSEGIRVVAREGGEPAELLRLRLSRIGRGQALVKIGAGTVSHRGQRVEIARAGLTEWYENRAEGLEQGFVVSERPAGQGALRLELEVTGAVASVQGDTVELASASGRRLRYGKLVAWDADGQPISARLDSAGTALALLVEDAQAAYPLTIDPLLSAVADSQLEANQASAFLGLSVAGAGDVNGDGYADVIVGARLFDNGQTNEGAAFVYHGGASGVSATFTTQLESNQASAILGSSVAGAGDVNGDGYADVIVGAYLFDNGQADEGAAFVYHGGASGVSATFATQLESNQVGGLLGNSVAGAGDVNGDGYADVIVGAYGFDNGQSDEGAAFVYHGSASGVSATFTTQLESDQASAFFGFSVAGAGDVNGDGYADVIVGADEFDNGQADEGAAFVYHGGASGVSATFTTQIESNQGLALLGFSVAGAGDVNGDGYADVIVGANGFDNGQTGEGAAFVYHGSASGVSATFTTQLESDQVSAQLGDSVAGAGDVNGDGYADVVVGASRFDNGQTDEGAVFVYYGGVSGMSTTFATQLESNQASAFLGISVAAAGDVNGDGYADVIVGAYLFDNGQTDEGAAFVYHGAASGVSVTSTTQLESNQASALLGISVAGAGDVNGDGYADVIVGAMFFDNGQTDEGAAFVYHGGASGVSATFTTQLESNQASALLGKSVAGAGDVNGDGYADVIVGAVGFDNGQADEGAAFVYHGGSGGVSATFTTQLEANQATAQLGTAVAGAGDVNGDGYADVIIGVPGFADGESNEGAAFVYHGGPGGVSATFTTQLESNQENASAGYSVAGAGDVDGDGFADVVIGAPEFANGETNEGAAFVYHGGPSGVSTTFTTQLDSDQVDAELGFSVAAAGDVNGDGFADVIVGAWRFANGEADEGAAFVYHGGLSGVSATFTTQLESNQVGAFLGYSVAGAGDVNGDGFTDVIVGANQFDDGQTDEGAAFVYHGGPSGVSATFITQLESNQATAILGTSVAGAGDVNGDGYADVIVGAPNFDNGQTDEGAAFVYLGGGGSGRQVRARQFRSGVSVVPVAPWGSSRGVSGFQVRMFATHPAGGGRVKLEIETCRAGKDFGDPSCTGFTSAFWVNLTADTGQTIIALVPGLTAARLHHWRARVLYAPASITAAGIVPPPKPAHGPWRRYQAQANEADFRTQDGVFYTVAPCRVVDTRGGAPIAGPILSDGVERTLLLTGQCAIPATARAVSLNLTAVTPTGPGSLVFYPIAGVPTNTTTVAFNTSGTRANNAVFGLNALGQLQVLPSVVNPLGADQVHLVVDVNGYFE